MSNSSRDNVKVIGITAIRQSGKDTLFQRLNALSPRFRRFAAADALKDQLAPFVRKYYGVDVWTAEGDDKELIRPLLIAHGMAMRKRDSSYWIKQVLHSIDTELDRNPQTVAVVTDVRFVNEASYLRVHYGDSFRLLYLTRDGSPPPTTEEEKHYRQVAGLADHTLHWGNDTVEQQLGFARGVCERFGVSLDEEFRHGAVHHD